MLCQLQLLLKAWLLCRCSSWWAHTCLGAVSAATPSSELTLVQMLFMVGPYLQAELGWRMFAALYFTAGVLANVAEYVGNVLLRCHHTPLLLLRFTCTAQIAGGWRM